MAFTAAVRTEMLKVFTDDTPTAYTTWYVSLHSGDPSTNGANEITGEAGDGYIRKTVAWDTPSNGASANSGAVVFTATGDWVEVSYFGIWTAESSGTFLAGGALTTPKTIQSGDTGTFAIGDLDLTIT